MDQDLNQRPRPLKGVLGPVDAGFSSSEVGGLNATDNIPGTSLTKSTPDFGQENNLGAAAAAAATPNLLGLPIAPISTASLDNRDSIAPIALTNGLSSSASRRSNNPGAIEPFNARIDSTLSLQNQLKHGDTPTGASAAGEVNLHIPKQPGSQHASSLVPVATGIATSSLQPAAGTSANKEAPSANGIHRPDVASSNSLAVINKPVLKMKRTGQNFPLTSNTGSIHQRNRSYSPSQRQGLLSSKGSATGKASALGTKGAQQPANGGTSKYLDERSSEKSTTLKVEPQQGFGLKEDSILKDSPAISARSSMNDRGNGDTSVAVHDPDSDDIIYETAAQVGAVQGDLGDVIDHRSSSEDSDSQSEDDDETVETDAGEASFRQLFQAPDQEDDYDDSEDASADREDDDATSESSSEEDPIAEEEPTVALPSANIQHQEAYPSTILEFAEPGRLYTEFRGMYSQSIAWPSLYTWSMTLILAHCFCRIIMPLKNTFQAIPAPPTRQTGGFRRLVWTDHDFRLNEICGT